MSETQVSNSQPSTQKLSEALSKAQGQIQAATKSAENPAFSRPGKTSTYAKLEDVIEVIQKPASDNGLSVIFNFKGDAANMFICYRLMHSSGEFIDSEWVPMFLRNKDLHGFGASNTFMRRQLLKAIYQIPEEDDDGNSQSLKPQNDPKPPAQQRKKQDPKPGTGGAQNKNGPPPQNAQPGNGGNSGAPAHHKYTGNPGDFVITFTKNFKGKAIKDIPFEDLGQLLSWCVDNNQFPDFQECAFNWMDHMKAMVEKAKQDQAT